MPKIVLVNPQIPPNTGNIARTCAATGCELHLVGPIGFELSDRYLKRAGLDYWPQVDLTYHSDFDHFQQHHQTMGGRQVGFSTAGKSSYIDFEFQPGDWLLFGSEGDGLPPAAVTQCDHLLRIPMPKAGVRSLNLSVSVGIGLFEALRQIGALQPQ